MFSCLEPGSADLIGRVGYPEPRWYRWESPHQLGGCRLEFLRGHLNAPRVIAGTTAAAVAPHAAADVTGVLNRECFCSAAPPFIYRPPPTP